MSTALGGCKHGSDFSDFDALTIARTGSFELGMSPAQALPLFTAPGERLWISINVAYQLTGLSAAGNADLEDSFSESQYAAMMEDWRSMINDSREKIDAHFGR